MWDAIREFLGATVSFFYGLIPNLGVAIILLTVAVGVVLVLLVLEMLAAPALSSLNTMSLVA